MFFFAPHNGRFVVFIFHGCVSDGANLVRIQILIILSYSTGLVICVDCYKVCYLIVVEDLFVDVVKTRNCSAKHAMFVEKVYN